MFDVLVYNENTFQNVTFRTGLSKKQAKELVKDLRKQGKKAQLKSAKGLATTEEIFIPEEGDGDEI